MKKILLFICGILLCGTDAQAAVRGENTAVRSKNNTVTNTQKTVRSTTSRNAIKTVVKPRSSKTVSILIPRTTTDVSKAATRTSASRSATTKKNISARATSANQTPVSTPSETRTGAAYEQCKTAFFTCMDQFCQLKNDNYRRCSCSNRVFDFQDISGVYQDANDRLTEFNENLDVVGLTKEQAIAMKTASEGEDALTEDKSASKQLLQAIMNSIKGGDTTVGGKYKDLNSITISADISNAFGMDDSGQIIASYNGATLYKAVYPKCRDAVKDDCNNASLQRAVNAYLMSIEQDCNTVESALQKQQKTLKATTHENSALLDLARVENRRKHNSDDTATCLVNVENAILSEEVCGANYHKCLDYGQFIDVTTGAPLTGVTNFYELGNLLTYKSDKDITDQKLAEIHNNQPFVQFFESKTKKFAQDALDKCSEDSDFVWHEYLNRALLDIHYAQKDKVDEIQQSCLDLVAKCYDNQNIAITNAMVNLTGDSTLLLKPAVISLTTEMCSKYIDSCNGMFDNAIIQTYIANKDSSDKTSACRAVVQQCFDKFGGTGYNNFYYTQSGLFSQGEALDWFSLYDGSGKIVSQCAQQLVNTKGCIDSEKLLSGDTDEKQKLEEYFGGFNKYTSDDKIVYSSVSETDTQQTIRSTGIATEVYYKVLDNLRNHCDGLGGYFVNYKYATQYGYKSDDFCTIDSTNPNSVFYISSRGTTTRSLVYWYHFLNEENMCPSNYAVEVDTQSWGMCSCWENGGRRSKNGKIATCRPLLPTILNTSSDEDQICTEDLLCKTTYNETDYIPRICSDSRSASSTSSWCQQNSMSSLGQICPLTFISQKTITTDTIDIVCTDGPEDPTNSAKGKEIPTVTNKVPHHTSAK